MKIVEAAEQDRSAIEALLRDAGLPVDDLLGSRVRFWVTRHEQAICGVIGVEQYGDAGLLRSLAVKPDQCGRGTASALVEGLESAMRFDGVRTLVLLTQTAEGFFAKRGYVLTSRESVPEQVLQTAQFRSVCPASAACLSKAL